MAPWLEWKLFRVAEHILTKGQCVFTNPLNLSGKDTQIGIKILKSVKKKNVIAMPKFYTNLDWLWLWLMNKVLLCKSCHSDGVFGDAHKLPKATGGWSNWMGVGPNHVTWQPCIKKDIYVITSEIRCKLSPKHIDLQNHVLKDLFPEGVVLHFYDTIFTSDWTRDCLIVMCYMVGDKN